QTRCLHTTGDVSSKLQSGFSQPSLFPMPTGYKFKSDTLEKTSVLTGTSFRRTPFLHLLKKLPASTTPPARISAHPIELIRACPTQPFERLSSTPRAWASSFRYFSSAFSVVGSFA